jgi:hypothetical protein
VVDAAFPAGAVDEDADVLDGVFVFELRICAQVGFDGEG